MSAIICVSQGLLLTSWASLAVDTHDKNRHDAFGETQTTMGVQNRSLFRVLPHTHTVPEASLSHSHYREGHSSHSDMLPLTVWCQWFQWLTPSVMWRPNCCQSMGNGSGESYLSVSVSESECSIMLKKQFVPREPKYLNTTTAACLPIFSSASLFMNSFLSAWQRETKHSYFSVFLRIKGEDIATTLPFFFLIHDLRAPRDINFFFPLNFYFHRGTREKITAVFLLHCIGGIFWTTWR